MNSAKFFTLNRRALKAVALASTLVLGGIGLVGNAQAANAVADTSAEVIVPIAIDKVADLSFGRFAANPSGGGTVIISNSGARSFGGGVVAAGTAGTSSAARFNVTGDGASTYSISITNTVLTHTNTIDTMALAVTSDLTGANVTTGTVTSGTLTAGAQSIYVGGTLTVASAKLAGEYSGTVTATVEYN